MDAWVWHGESHVSEGQSPGWVTQEEAGVEDLGSKVLRDLVRMGAAEMK